MFFKKKKNRNLGFEELTFKERVSIFWKWYETQAQRFYNTIEAGGCSELESDVSDAVGKLGLVAWVFGPGPEEKGGHSFTLSGEGILHIQFLTQYWLSCAPVLDSWTFYAERQPGNVHPKQSFKIGGRSFYFREVWISPRVDLENKEVDIVAWHHHFCDIDSEDRMTVLFLMLDEVLGEYGTVNWIGKIDTSDNKLEISMPIIELRDFILELEIENGWKKYPPTESYSSYTVPTLDNSFRRSDVYVGATANFDLVREFMDAEGNMENPLKGTGADFVYVAFSSSILPKGSEVDFRAKIEDSIDNLLKADESGRVLGGAMGRENAYIDIVIFDGARSIVLINEALRDFDLPSGTSIYHFEQDREVHRVVL